LNFFTLTFWALGRNHIVSSSLYWPSQCFVFIIQSNSLSLFQFQITHMTSNFLHSIFTVYIWSHTLLQTYGTNLPTSLTYFLLFNQRFLTLETCCGYWYGLLFQFIRYILFLFGFYDIIISIIIINLFYTLKYISINYFPFFTFSLIDLFSRYSYTLIQNVGSWIKKKRKLFIKWWL